jgi:ABC-2 type transport system ATP-binding protein
VPAPPIIEVAGLEKHFGSQAVLRGVDLDVRAGEIFALLGPNGAGKTTTVNILTTLIKPDGGRATIAGYDVARDPAKVRGAISLTGQHAAVDEFLTGRENLRMMGRLAHLGTPTARARADDLLERFDLTDAAGRRVATWSGGMRRRLDLAISLIAEPPVIFLDEPTTGLDPRSRQAFWAIVRGLAADGTTIFLTTQYLDEADQLADRIAVIDDGRIIAEGTAADLKRGVSGERVELTFPDAASFAAAADLIRAREGSLARVGPVGVSDPAAAERSDAEARREGQSFGDAEARGQSFGDATARREGKSFAGAEARGQSFRGATSRREGPSFADAEARREGQSFGDAEARRALMSFGAVATDAERLAVSVAATNAVATTRQLLELMDDHRLPIDAIEVVRPSLDDVFLALTGHGAAAEEAAA